MSGRALILSLLLGLASTAGVALAEDAAPAPTQSASAGPATGTPSASTAAAKPPAAKPTADAPAAGSDNGGYVLGAGDKVRLSVFGETDLGGDFDIDGTGDVRLPLIGPVKAAGLTIHAFEDKAVALLSDGYLKDPKVSIEVVNYRPFYIIGEVNKPGQYSYVDGMTALNAVALAGGYTPKADKSEVYIQRGGKDETEFPSDESTAVRPGDVVRIPERFF